MIRAPRLHGSAVSTLEPVCGNGAVVVVDDDVGAGVVVEGAVVLDEVPVEDVVEDVVVLGEVVDEVVDVLGEVVVEEVVEVVDEVVVVLVVLGEVVVEEDDVLGEVVDEVVVVVVVVPVPHAPEPASAVADRLLPFATTPFLYVLSWGRHVVFT